LQVIHLHNHFVETFDQDWIVNLEGRQAQLDEPMWPRDSFQDLLDALWRALGTLKSKFVQVIRLPLLNHFDQLGDSEGAEVVVRVTKLPQVSVRLERLENHGAGVVFQSVVVKVYFLKAERALGILCDQNFTKSTCKAFTDVLTGDIQNAIFDFWEQWQSLGVAFAAFIEELQHSRVKGRIRSCCILRAPIKLILGHLSKKQLFPRLISRLRCWLCGVLHSHHSAKFTKANLKGIYFDRRVYA